MIISVVNKSTVRSDEEVHQAIRAINRQIAEDVAPYWGRTATLRLDGTGRGGAIGSLRGDALLTLRDEHSAYHDAGTADVPEGIVFTQLAEAVRETHPWMQWTVSFSHEALELLLDPHLNTMHRGPHPTAKRQVFHYREVCDPVQSSIYAVDGVMVANFVTPAYYGPGTRRTADTNFLGLPLRPFGWLPHGCICFWDPGKGRRGGYVMWPPFGSHDVRRKIINYKQRSNAARIVRYTRHGRDGRGR